MPTRCAPTSLEVNSQFLFPSGIGRSARSRWSCRYRHDPIICRQPFYADIATQAVDGPGRTGRIVGIKQGSIKICGVKRPDRPPSERGAVRSRSTFGRSAVDVGYVDPTDFDASHICTFGPFGPSWCFPIRDRRPASRAPLAAGRGAGPLQSPHRQPSAYADQPVMPGSQGHRASGVIRRFVRTITVRRRPHSASTLWGACPGSVSTPRRPPASSYFIVLGAIAPLRVTAPHRVCTRDGVAGARDC